MNGSSNNNYTYKDIQRYHTGEMSAEEMHQLEKAALNDPFLADALEGYKNTPNAEQDLSTLKIRIKEKAARKIRVAWISRNNNWLKVAAILLLIAVGGWFFLNSNKSSNENIAIHQDSTSKTNQLTTSQSFSKPKDTTKTGNDSISGYAYHTEIKKQVRKIFERKEPSNSVALNKPLQPKNELRNKEVTSAPSLSNEKIEPVNKNDNLKSKAAPELKDVQSGVAANADMASGKTNDTIKNLNVTLQPAATPALSEVVINKKKSFNRADRYKTPQLVVPEHGWPSFNEYVQANLNRTAKAGIDSTGDVELSFDITDAGRPVNIQVEKSLCSPCDREAIRLLQDGPKWIKKQNYKGKVSIHF